MDNSRLIKTAIPLSSIFRTGANLLRRGGSKILRSLKSTDTAKAFSKMTRGGKSKGFKGFLDEAAKYKHPEVNIGKTIPKSVKLPKEQLGKPTLGRGVRSVVGNVADTIKGLTKGLGKGSAGNRAKQLVSNVENTLKKQLKGSQFTEKEFSNKATKLINKDGKKFLKSRSKFLPDREVIQETGRGVLVKKRLPMRVIAPLTTSPGAVGATTSTFIGQSALEPNKPVTDKLKTSLQEGGRFIAGDAIGFASYLL